MFELGLTNAAGYIESRPELAGEHWGVTELGGGVSNTVLLLESGSARIVLKQSLPQLRVAEEWLADRSRIHRECAAMRRLASHLRSGAVPDILFEDEPNFLFAMEAAPADARTWKQLLLEGEADEAIAEQVASALADMFRASWGVEAWEHSFGDQEAFDQLRLDPYYRFTASRHPDLTPHFEARIREARERRRCLVHGDWSPKNVLVAGGRVMFIDFEVIHYGDPSFDTAFLLNHLLLKSFHKPEWATRYQRLAAKFREVIFSSLPDEADWLEPATCCHLGCLLLARVDGKSPAEYVQSEETKHKIRDYARRLIPNPPRAILEVFENAPR